MMAITKDNELGQGNMSRYFKYPGLAPTLLVLFKAHPLSVLGMPMGPQDGGEKLLGLLGTGWFKFRLHLCSELCLCYWTVNSRGQ